MKYSLCVVISGKASWWLGAWRQECSPQLLQQCTKAKKESTVTATFLEALRGPEGPEAHWTLPGPSLSFLPHLQLCVILPSLRVACGLRWEDMEDTGLVCAAGGSCYPCWTIFYSGRSLPSSLPHPGSVSKTPKTSMVSQAGPCGVAVEFCRALNGVGKHRCAFV